MDINLNEEVLVKLTPYAISIMVKNHLNVFKNASHAPDFRHPKVDSEGWSKMPLWELMKEFGSVMYMGNMSQCFEDNVIRIL